MTNQKKKLSRFYHATRLANVMSIQETGLKPLFGEVYLTDSIESACRWMGFRFEAMGDNTFAVVEVEADPNKLEDGTDHSPIMQSMFGAGKSLVSNKRIPKSRIKKIHYFSIKPK